MQNSVCQTIVAEPVAAGDRRGSDCGPSRIPRRTTRSRRKRSSAKPVPERDLIARTPSAKSYGFLFQRVSYLTPPYQFPKYFIRGGRMSVHLRMSAERVLQ